MERDEIEAIVLDILKKQRKKRLKKSKQSLKQTDKYKEQKENDYIISCHEDDFRSIYHDYDIDRNLH